MYSAKLVEILWEAIGADQRQKDQRRICDKLRVLNRGSWSKIGAKHTDVENCASSLPVYADSQI